MTVESWIKLHRKFKQWEWYSDSKMVHLFLHLLLSANHEDGKWRGVSVQRGQLIAGLNSLSADTGISIQTLRTCLRRLEETGEINRQSSNQFSIITVCNYEQYQTKEEDGNKQSNKRVTSDQQAINNNLRSKEVKKEPLCKFDTFWNAYPKKKNRKKAEQIWQKLNPDAELFEEIMTGLRAQMESSDWQKEGGQYIPLATTWLNGRRWEDEIDTEQYQANSGLQLVGNRRVF